MIINENNSLILDELGNFSQNFLEIGIDSLIKDGMLKEIPIVGSIFSFAKIGFTIKDQILLKKISLFLFQIGKISDEERNQFLYRINADNNFKEKVNESLLLILDKLNDYTKAEMIGKLFAVTIQGKIDYNMFLKLSNIIDKAYCNDLKNLLPIYKKESDKINYEEMDELYSLGVLSNIGISGNTFLFDQDDEIPNTQSEFIINKYGIAIVEFILME